MTAILFIFKKSPISYDDCEHEKDQLYLKALIVYLRKELVSSGENISYVILFFLMLTPFLDRGTHVWW